MFPHSFSLNVEASSPQPIFPVFLGLKTQNSKIIQQGFSLQETGSKSVKKSLFGTSSDDSSGSCRISLLDTYKSGNEAKSKPVVGFAPLTALSPSGPAENQLESRTSLLSEQLMNSPGLEMARWGKSWGAITRQSFNSDNNFCFDNVQNAGNGIDYVRDYSGNNEGDRAPEILSSISDILGQGDTTASVPDINVQEIGIETLEFEEQQLWHQTLQKYQVFDSPQIREAFCVAARAFRGQNRRNGDPVLVHSIETAKILAELGSGETLIVVALLHDVLDDTHMTESMLAEFVSRDTIDKVLGVSKLSSLSQLYRDAGNSEDVQDVAKASNLYIAMVEVEAVLVKLADRLHNMRTLDALPKFKRIRIARETLDVFVPIANRLGIWWIKQQLEDLCFQHLYPEEFEHLRGLQSEDMSKGELESILDGLSIKFSEKNILIEDLYGRTKSLYGVFKKLQRKGQADVLQTLNSVSQRLFDLRGIRIIVRSKSDCYKAAREVERMWKPVPGRYKDYIRNPKENGYQSLHLVVYGPGGVPVEVQIRTAKMHYLAEYGVAAHWSYKESNYDSKLYDKQQAVLVRYKRWLTQNLKLYDMKLRPSGGISFDHSFDSLSLDPPNVKKVSESAPTVSGAGDAFTRYMQEHRLLPASRIDENESPVTVVCSTRQTEESFNISYRTFPAKTTVQAYLDKYGVQDQKDMQIFVNNKVVVNYEKELQNGDVVEVSRKLEDQQFQQESLSGSSYSSKLNMDVQLLDVWGSNQSVQQKRKEKQQQQEQQQQFQQTEAQEMQLAF